MASFLDWFASHNTLVIQSLAAIVALLIVALIFRLLFANQAATAEGLAHNVTYAQLEEKLNKLLEQQSLMRNSVNAATQVGTEPDALGAEAVAALSGDPAAAEAVAIASTPSEQLAELNRLRGEITTLKDSLNRKESEITAAKEQAAQSANSSQANANLSDLNNKITDYESEIETLKSRLSDYEIIAEDIADLQKYKKENQDLKNQLASQPAAEVAAAPAEGMPDLTSEDEPVEDVKAEPVVEAAAQATVDPNAMPEPTTMPSTELDTVEAREVSKDVKKEDKVLLDEFEKHFAKDDD